MLTRARGFMSGYLTSQEAQELAAQRIRYRKRCLICRALVTGLRTRKFCSNACRQRHKRYVAQLRGRGAAHGTG